MNKTYFELTTKSIVL